MQIKKQQDRSCCFCVIKLLNQLSLDLLCRGLFELGLADLDSLDLLVCGKLLIGSVDDLLERLVYGLVVNVLFKLRVVGIDHSGQNDLVARLALSSDYATLCDDIDSIEILLDLLGEYVLTVFKNDNRLLSACDEEISDRKSVV